MDRVNKWMTLIANIGVVAGIVFLAFEIRVNTQAVASDSATSYLNIWIDQVGENSRDPEITAIAMKADVEGWDSIPPQKQLRLGLWATSQFKAAEFAHFQWREGNLDPGLWQGNDAGLYMFLASSHFMKDHWRSGGRLAFAPKFRDYVDLMIEDICSKLLCRETQGGFLSAQPEVIQALNG